MHEPVYSYAQNREDVLLWRALKDVPSECGKWIDVGANDPLRDSVTQLFSIRGWSGINVEPVRSCFDRLCQWRSRDVNILGACSDSDGPLRLFRVADNTALSTADLSLAAYYRQANCVWASPLPQRGRFVGRHRCL